jgi:uncharacterized membrane protein
MPWIDWFVTEEGHHLPRPVRRWVWWFGRAGIASRGIIYFSIGLLAAMAALKIRGGRTTDAEGAMEAITELPLGGPLVVLIAVGLAGYALWRLAEAIFNLEHLDRSASSKCLRCYYVLDGLFHAAFAVFVVMALQPDGQSDGESTRAWTAQLMSQPMGRWLVGAVGVGTILSGLYLFVRACSHKFSDEWHDRHMGRGLTRGCSILARFGEVARGVIFVMVGFFLTRAAWRFDPDDARGLGESLQILASQPLGRGLLGVTALGLIAYGVYSFVDAAYRRLGPSEKDEQTHPQEAHA